MMEKLTGVKNPHSTKITLDRFLSFALCLSFCDVLMESLLNQSHKMHKCLLVLYFTTQHLVDFFSYSFCISEN